MTLKSKNGIYEENVSFEQLVELYRFNANFRQIIFPEINYDQVNVVRGMDVVIVTTAKTNKEAYSLLQGLGMPFEK